MPRMYEFFRHGVRLELRPLKGKRVALLLSARHVRPAFVRHQDG